MRANRPPKLDEALFENLFCVRKPEETIEVISRGLSSFLTNATRLLGDVEVLVRAERYATAAFLLATAHEEMAKTYIMLDACRLDFSRHTNVLKALCRAFYDHVIKHAYARVACFSGFADMGHVRVFWDAEVTRWWPSTHPESGEPDMPHDTYFAREMPLYVDFIEYDGAWSVPDSTMGRMKFDGTLRALGAPGAKDALDRLARTAALARLSHGSGRRAAIVRPEVPMALHS